ncbi:hypothetical protein [Kitasatospora azatica]|nr:hypothetical protein [Kitasatospora azatica]
MGVLAFFAALLTVVMSFGRWHETHSPLWLAVSIALLVLTLVGGLFGRGK